MATPYSNKPRARVATLLGHRQVEVALPCLNSVVRHGSAQRVSLQIHDDGTLEPGDVDSLRARLGPVRIIGRREADLRLADHLRRNPRTRELRETNPLALKLVDTVLLAEGDSSLYCDADILFLRPYSGLWSAPETGVLFMQDSQNAYSVLSRDLHRLSGLRLAQKVNTGVVALRQSQYDSEFIEWLLGRPEIHRTPVWVEQTCWAALGARIGCRVADPRRVRVATRREMRLEEIVALHLVSSIRSRFLWLLRDAPDRLDEPSVEIGTFPCRPCGPLGLARTEVSRKLTALAHRFVPGI